MLIDQKFHYIQIVDQSSYLIKGQPMLAGADLCILEIRLHEFHNSFCGLMQPLTIVTVEIHLQLAAIEPKASRKSRQNRDKSN